MDEAQIYRTRDVPYSLFQLCAFILALASSFTGYISHDFYSALQRLLLVPELPFPRH